MMYDYLYRSNQSDHTKTLLHLVKSTGELCRIYLTQYVFHNSKKIRKNVYEIEYTIHCKTFRFHTHYKPTPSKYHKFMKDDSTDISDIIFPFVGPNDDFHRIPYTPKCFGYDSMTILYLNGDKRFVDGHEYLLG